MTYHRKKIGIITLHDVNAFPDHLNKSIQTMKQLGDLNVKYNIAIIPNYLKKYTITKDNFTRVIYKHIKKDNLNIALHGLYHEYRQSIEDYFILTTDETKAEIAQGLTILKKADIIHEQPKTFIPPAWHISPSTAEALHDMGFEVSESMDKIELIQRNIAIITQQVMNWDISGDTEQNKPTIKQNQQIYEKIMRGFKPTILRIAIHPPHDPPEALDQQLEIIKGLENDADYKFKTYDDFIKEDIYGY
jgi:predicted deacetylase